MALGFLITSRLPIRHHPLLLGLPSFLPTVLKKEQNRAGREGETVEEEPTVRSSPINGWLSFRCVSLAVPTPFTALRAGVDEDRREI